MLAVLLYLAFAIQNPAAAEPDTPADAVAEARAVLASVEARKASDLQRARDDVAEIVEGFLNEQEPDTEWAQ